MKIEGIGVSATGQIGCGTPARLLAWVHSSATGSAAGEEILEDRFHLPVTVINDANAAALGEQTFGRAKGKENVLVVTVGTGIGGGIIENGRLIQGRRGIGGEIGHYIINLTVWSARAATAAALSATVLRARLCAVLRRMLHCSKSWAYRQKTSTAK